MRSSVVGAGILFLLIVVPDRGTWTAFLYRLCRIMAAFILGIAMMHAALPNVPDKPSWAAVPRQAVSVEGRISSVTGLPGGRIRLLLEELRPVPIPSDILPEEAETIRKAMAVPRYASERSGVKSYAGALFHDAKALLPGLAALTLDTKLIEEYGRPLAGQRIRALVRLFPSGGSIDADKNGVNAYWAAREVWHNARLVWRDGHPLLLALNDGDGWYHHAVKKREEWRAGMEALFREGLPADVRETADADRSKGSFGREPEPPAWSQGHAMLTALLFGDRSGLSLHTVDMFTRAGLVHSLALSGQHLILAAMAGIAVIFLLSRQVPGLYRRYPRRVLMACAGLPFALAYLFIGGAPFSLVRASLMMLAGAAFLCFRKQTTPLDALFAAAFLLFIGWPPAIFEISAQLSVLAVAGIMLSMPLIKAFRHRLRAEDRDRLPQRAIKASLRWGGTMLLVSCAAQLAVLPVLASMFGAVSPSFWLNLIWLPLLTFVSLPLAALGLVAVMLVGPQSFSAVLFDAAACPADAMLAVLEQLDGLGWLPFFQCFRPTPLSSLGYCAFFAALTFVSQAHFSGKAVGRSLRRLLCLGLLFMLAGQMPQWLDDVRSHVERRVTLSMIDVGLGQSVLIDYPGGRVLVDGGGSVSPYFDPGRSIVAPALTEGRLPRLDAVIVSHADVDHARGLRWILEHFDVGALYWSEVTACRADGGEAKILRDIAKRRGIPEKILLKGDTLELGGGAVLKVLGPYIAAGTPVPDAKALSSNNASLVLRLERHGHGLALLCGDMLSPALRKLVKSGQDMSADVLVLPHHGAASGFQKRFYDAVSPRAALVSTASFSHYGFPSTKVRQEMARRGIPLFSTSEIGTFEVFWKQKDGKDELLLGDIVPCSVP